MKYVTSFKTGALLQQSTCKFLHGIVLCMDKDKCNLMSKQQIILHWYIGCIMNHREYPDTDPNSDSIYKKSDKEATYLVWYASTMSVSRISYVGEEWQWLQVSSLYR